MRKERSLLIRSLFEKNRSYTLKLNSTESNIFAIYIFRIQYIHQMYTKSIEFNLIVQNWVAVLQIAINLNEAAL